MRILFSSLAAHGHLYPTLPLAIAARQQGHEVLFVTDRQFAPIFEQHDIAFAQGGIGIRQAFLDLQGNPDTLEPKEVPHDVIARVFGSIIPRRFIDDLRPILADWKPDLVVRGIANLGAGFAAELAGVPALSHGFGRMWSPDVAESLWQDNVTALAAEIGLGVEPDHAMLLGNTYVDVCPPSFQDKEFLASDVRRVPLRPVPFAEPGELPDWVVAHDRPLVYLTLGTAFAAEGVLRTAIEGLARLDARVLVASGPTVDPASLGALPAGVEVRQWVPQADLLPYTDLVVHHGGSGTTLGAFSAGVPQLIVPQGADQFNNAEHVTAGGLGDRLLGEAVTAETVADRAGALLADTVIRDAARLIAAEITSLPAPADVARALPDLI
ncbi:nucleotide disphospho-sugar-binding domain-containing protein [Actinosynnema sp. NPDC020468]|uniref:glycosyltransferase n=1 Tax=Actinosynnema sp. NPDC020468 TaxID=3154488 RepID=UPI0033D0AE80